MGTSHRLRDALGAAVADAGGAAAIADRLCRVCVELLPVDAASLSLSLSGQQRGTLGSDTPSSRLLDELQFTYGEGPCLDAVADDRPVLVADLTGVQDRWPLYAGAVLAAGVSAVFALPVRLSGQAVGALDLYRGARGPLSRQSVAGGLLAAELAALPLLDLLAAHGRWSATGQQDDGWTQLASLDRVEVYQATGMIMGALGVDGTEALVRLRAYAFVAGLPVGEAAWAIVERQVALTGPDWQDDQQGRDGTGGRR